MSDQLKCNGMADNDGEFEEVQIPVPWGHVAGKWWGATTTRPILTLHGWQDNAGSFDRLIPLLPKQWSYLVVDFPGHGLSSHIPDGMTYNIMDFVQLINIIKEHYKWSHVSILAHSLGSIVGFLYNGIFPDRCDMMIGIDVLKPLVRDNDELVKQYGMRMDKIMEENRRRDVKSMPPTYETDELIEKVYVGSGKSVTRETASYLIARNVKESDTEPNRFYFSRDNRLKYFYFAHFHTDLILDMIGKIRAPYLFIKANGGPYYEDKQHFDEALEAFKQHSKFRFVTVDGTHHVQLTAPENVANEVGNFIDEIKGGEPENCTSAE